MHPTTPTALPTQPTGAPATRRIVQWIATASVVPGLLMAIGDTASAAPARSFPGCPVLSEKPGHDDPCVVRLQVYLDTVNPGYHLERDGGFGPHTRVAVLDFQGRNHLGADGSVGPITADELTRQAQALGSVETPSPSGIPAAQQPTSERHTLPPGQAKSAALGLIDATGRLALQCGLSKVGDRIRAGSVAADAVKESLAISGAKSSCSGVKNLVEAVAVIVALAEADRPVYLTVAQSQTNKWWGFGFVKTCTVGIRAGASSSLAKSFTATFTCG